MALYFFNILVVVSLCGICNYKFKTICKKNIPGEKIYNGIVFFIFTFIMGARALSVGVDTAPYSRIFGIIARSESLIDAISKAPLTAPLYVFCCRILSYISSQPQILTIFCAVVINIGLVVFIIKTSPSPCVSYLVWIGLTLFYFSMNGTRQSISLILVLNALVFLAEDIKSCTGWILFIGAILIHTTAIFAIIVIAGILLTSKIKDNKKIFIISTAASIVISRIYGVGVQIVSKLSPHYSMYTDEDAKYSIFISTGKGRIVLLYLVLLGVVILWILGNDNKSNTFNKRIFPAVIFGTIFGIANCKNELINRMLWYYIALYISFIPSMLFKYKKKSRIPIAFCIIGILIVYSTLSLCENQNGVVPYHFYWS